MVEKAGFSLNVGGRTVKITEGMSKDMVRFSLGLSSVQMNSIWKGVDKNEAGCKMNMLDKCEFTTFQTNVMNKKLNGNKEITVEGGEEELSEELLSQIKEENGKFSIKYCIGVGDDNAPVPNTSFFNLSADTKEELVSKLTQLEKLKKAYSNLMELDNDGWAHVKVNPTEEDKETYIAVAKELLETGNEDLQTAVAFTYSRSEFHDEELFDSILATKNPIAVNRLVGGWTYESISLEQAKKFYALTKDSEFLENCKNHPDKDAKNIPNEIAKEIIEAYDVSKDRAKVDFAKQVYKESSHAIRNSSSYYFRFADAKDIVEHAKEYNLSRKDIFTLLLGRYIGYSKEDFDYAISKLPNLRAEEVQKVKKILNTAREFASSDRDDAKDYEWAKDYHVVDSGESLRGIIARHILKNGLCEYINEKTDWDDKRKMEAAMEYARDFEEEIAEKIGVKQENLKAGQVIDFSKVDTWPQPNWFNWKLFY